MKLIRFLWRIGFVLRWCWCYPGGGTNRMGLPLAWELSNDLCELPEAKP